MDISMNEGPFGELSFYIFRCKGQFNGAEVCLPFQMKTLTEEELNSYVEPALKLRRHESKDFMASLVKIVSNYSGTKSELEKIKKEKDDEIKALRDHISDLRTLLFNKEKIVINDDGVKNDSR